MPPEVMVANPKYDTSIDIFSFGVMIIHVLSGQWPEPQIGPNRIDPETERLVPVSEAERRGTFLDLIGRDHPLMNLVIKCTDNNRKRRPSAGNAAKQLTEVVSNLSAQFANRLEMLRRIEADEKEKKALKMEQERKYEEARQKEKQIVSLKEEGQRNEEKKSEQLNQLQLAFSTEFEQQKLEIDDLKSQIQVLTSEKQSISRAAEVAQKEKETLATQMNKYKREMKITLKSFEDKLYNERDRQRQQLAEEKERYEKYLQEERDLLKKASAQNLTLEAAVTSLRVSEEQLKSSSLAKEALLASKESELEIKIKALQEKNVTISGMNEQLTSTRKFLAATQQV
jgi:serine/threonine protein kinase